MSRYKSINVANNQLVFLSFLNYHVLVNNLTLGIDYVIPECARMRNTVEPGLSERLSFRPLWVTNFPSD